MTSVKCYRDLEVWQVSIDLVERCYRLTENFPRTEQFGLQLQLRKACVSISANIAEGHQRPRQAYLNHLSIALGSQAEVETHLEICGRLKYLAESDRIVLQELTSRVGRLLHRLVRSLQ